MRRVAPLMAGIAGVGLILPVVVGLRSRTIIFFVPLFAALGAVALVGSRRAALIEPGWSGAGGRGPALAPGPAAGPPAVRPRPSPSRVAAALSRVEAREMATSPWYGLGLGFLIMIFLMLVVFSPDDNASHWTEMVDMAPWLAHPLVGMMVVAAHRGMTRARRDGADELFDTCPVAPTTRTWGALGAAWVPVLTLIAFCAVLGTAVAVRSPNLYGTPGTDAAAQLLAAFALGLGGVVLGVALGRWVPFALAPAVAVIAVGFVSLKLATVGDPGWNPLQQLSTFPPLSDDPPVFRDPPAWSHLAWILALTGAVLLVALARHRRDRAVAVLAVSACLLLTATGLAATRAMPATSAARIAARIADPAPHQACLPAGSIRVCTFADHEELGRRVVDELIPVAAMLPEAALPLTLRQRYPGTVDDLPPEVARRLPDGVPPRPADEVAVGFSASPEALREPGFLVALHALGLPQEPDPDNRPLVIAGQARGVVGLWLATRGLRPVAARERISGRTARDLGNREPDAFDRGYAWSGCTSPVVWSAQDLRAARALSALPEATVRAAVHEGWDRWRDPATGTDELLAAVGVPPVGPFDAFATRAESSAC